MNNYTASVKYLESKKHRPLSMCLIVYLVAATGFEPVSNEKVNRFFNL